MLAKQAHINRRSQCDQPLVGADIGSGFLAADVLLTGGQGEHISALAAVIDSLAYQAPRHLAHVLFAGGKDAQVGSTKRERDAQRLTFASDDICAELTGRLEQSQGGGVDRHSQQRASLRGSSPPEV